MMAMALTSEKTYTDSVNFHKFKAANIILLSRHDYIISEILVGFPNNTFLANDCQMFNIKNTRIWKSLLFLCSVSDVLSFVYIVRAMRQKQWNISRYCKVEII